MINFFNFLKTLIFSHYNILALVLLVMVIAYTFNNAKDTYMSMANLNDNAYAHYSEMFYNACIVLSLSLLSAFIYFLFKNGGLPGFVRCMVLYCGLMVLLLFFMLICQNEMRIMAGYGSLSTPLNNVFHYLRYEPSLYSMNDTGIDINNISFNNSLKYGD